MTRVNTGITFRNNDISTESIYELNTGKRTFRPVNVSGNNNWFFWGMHSWGDNGKSKWKHQVNTNASGSLNNAILNFAKYTTLYNTLGAGYYVNYDASEHFQISSGAGAQHFSTKTTMSTMENATRNNYRIYSLYGAVVADLPWKMQFSSELNASLYERMEGLGAQNNLFIWNAVLSKGILKNNKLKISLDAHDILNQNQGFNRVITTNIITESRVTQLGRYVMVKLQWLINSAPQSQNK